MSLKSVSKLFENKTFLLISLLLIFAGALIVRSANLGTMPSGFHRDEVISGYIGRFILQNGQDIRGNTLPLLYFDKYGDYPPVIPMYFSGFGTYIFGVNILATRFPVALIGALLIFPIFFLAKEFFKDNKVGIFASIFVALLPWHIVLSRATAEGVIALTVITCGMILLMKSLHKKQNALVVGAILLFVFTYLLYPSYRILAPLISLPVPFLFNFEKQKKIIAVAGLVIMLALTLLISTSTWGKGRYDQTSMFASKNSQATATRVSTLAQEEGTNHVTDARIYHNKYVLYGKQFIRQYLEYFSPNYLFIAGGLPFRYSVTDEGLLYLILLPLILFGLISIGKTDHKKAIYLIYLLIISPLPAPITIDDIPNVHRTLFMIIPLIILAAYGLSRFIDVTNKDWLKKIIIAVVVIVLAIESIYFFHMYNHHSNAVASIERGDSNVEVINYLISQKGKYENVYVSVNDAFPIYYLYLTNNFGRQEIGKFRYGLKTDKIDNVIFTDAYCPEKVMNKEELKKNILIVDSTDCPADPTLNIMKTFSRHDGTTSYRFSTPIK